MAVATYPTIREGYTGELVIQLQTFLSILGSKVKVDGIFDIGTRTAVKTFQKKHCMEATGVVNRETWSKLMELAGHVKMV